VRTVADGESKGWGRQNHYRSESCAALAAKGLKILLVDIDPQGNAGMHLLGPEVGAYEDTIYQS